MECIAHTTSKALTDLEVNQWLLSDKRHVSENKPMAYSDNEIQDINKRWLKEALSQKGLTQQALADACGVEKQSVFNWLKTGKIKTAHLMSAITFLDFGLPCWLSEFLESGGFSIPSALPEPAKQLISLLSEVPEDELVFAIKVLEKIAATSPQTEGSK